MTADALMTEQPETTTNLLATIRAARAGDGRAFEEIMQLTERRVAVLAWRILGDAEEVKEALQETFLRLFRHLQKYDESQDFFGWLYRIAVNVCRDLQKRRRRREIFRPIEEALGLSRQSRQESDLARRDEVALLTRAIDQLPPRERLAIILREVEELPTEEVAAILGSSPATVRVQVSKGRQKIREWMERWR